MKCIVTCSGNISLKEVMNDHFIVDYIWLCDISNLIVMKGESYFAVVNSELVQTRNCFQGE